MSRGIKGKKGDLTVTSREEIDSLQSPSLVSKSPRKVPMLERVLNTMPKKPLKKKKIALFSPLFIGRQVDSRWINLATVSQYLDTFPVEIDTNYRPIYHSNYDGPSGIIISPYRNRQD